MLKLVVCGLERSGTTVVSELLRQVPGVDAGFEIGVLLGRTPREFLAIQPFSGNMLWNWGLTQDALAQCCDTGDFAAFYGRLLAASTVMRPGTGMIFDKTPRYLATLDDCMAKTPVPFIVTFKDPRGTVFSDFKAAGAADFDGWFDAYAPAKIGYMRLHYEQFERVRKVNDPRALLVRLEDLCLHPGTVCPRILAHAGFDFDYAYLAFRQGRYQPAPVGSLTTGLPFAYMNALGKTRSNRVREAFAEFPEWFFP
jgi:hypothetical protein